jgi:hypothetical protein
LRRSFADVLRVSGLLKGHGDQSRESSQDPHPPSGRQKNKMLPTEASDCKLFLVVRHTGKMIARVPVSGVKPSIGQIFIGPDAVYYPATDAGSVKGYLNRISAN